MEPLTIEKVRLIAAALLQAIALDLGTLAPNEIRAPLLPRKKEAFDRFFFNTYGEKDGEFSLLIFLAIDLVEEYSPTWERKTIPGIAALLKEMSKIWSRHGCSDFNLENVLPDVNDRRAYAWEYHNWNGDPEEFDPQGDYRFEHDWVLMSYCAERMGGATHGLQPANKGER